MKMFPKMQDHTIDRLLRAQGGGSGKVLPPCREFDADLANAYVERSLTASETAGYEQHLAVCSPCRKSIVALTRMAQTDAEAARTDTAVGRTQGESRVKRWFGALTPPQWAMAAAAAIVLAITLPLILSSRTAQKNQPDAATELAQSQAANLSASEAAPGAAPAATATATNSAADAAREPSASGRAAASAEEKPAPVAETKKAAPAEPPAPGRDEAAATPAAAKPAESRPADQVVAKNDTQSTAGAPAPTTQPAAAEAPLPKIDEKEAKQLPNDKDAAKATTIKPGQTDGEARDKAEAAVRSEIAPPPVHGPRADSARQRRNEGVTTGVPGRAFRESSGGAASAPRAASRKVGNHLFWLRGETWTDKDYDPNKDMPVVTIIRDSDVYRDLLTKDEKIKPFLTGFAVDARVIFIFKGTVYKLIPQDGDR
jgi:hypothetical protein